MTLDRERVGEVLKLERRAVFVEPDGEYEEIGVRSFGRGIFHKEPVTGLNLGAKRVFHIEPHDLVISNVFAWEGAISVASEAEVGKIGSHRFMTFVPRHDRIDTQWAAWFFLSEPGLELIRKASPGSAGRNRTLAIDRFEALEIPLPHIDEQRRVADRLDRLKGATDALRKRSDQASELSSALMISAASRPDLDDREKQRAGWRRVPLEELLDLHNDVTAVADGDSFGIAGVYSFGWGMFRRAAVDGSQTSYKVLHRLHAGQLVMSRLKAWEGALALVPADLEGWFLSPEFPTFNIDNKQVDSRFLSAVVTAERFWTRLKGASQGIGARRERVNAARLLEMHVDLPPIEEQRRLSRQVQQLDLIGQQRPRVNAHIAALVPAALNRAFHDLS